MNLKFRGNLKGLKNYLQKKAMFVEGVGIVGNVEVPEGRILGNVNKMLSVDVMIGRNARQRFEKAQGHVSNCCGANVQEYANEDYICWECKEHCGVEEDVQELRDEMIENEVNEELYERATN